MESRIVPAAGGVTPFTAAAPRICGARLQAIRNRTASKDPVNPVHRQTTRVCRAMRSADFNSLGKISAETKLHSNLSVCDKGIYFVKVSQFEYCPVC
jgi:hypothetical protein